MWPTILVGAVIGAAINLAIYGVSKKLKGEPMTWKGAVAAGVGGLVGGAIAGSGVGILAGGGARALSFVATNGAVSAGSETLTRNALEKKPLLKNVVHDAAVGAATAPLLYGVFRSASRLLPEVEAAVAGKVPVRTVVADVKDALVKVGTGDVAGLVGGDAAATAGTAATNAARAAPTGLLAATRDKLAGLFSGAARSTVSGLRNPTHHVISASALTHAVGPVALVARNLIVSDDDDEKPAKPATRVAPEATRVGRGDSGLPPPRRPRPAAPVTSLSTDMTAITINIAANTPAGTTINVAGGRPVVINIVGAPEAPARRSGGLVAAVAGEQRRAP